MWTLAYALTCDHTHNLTCVKMHIYTHMWPWLQLYMCKHIFWDMWLCLELHVGESTQIYYHIVAHNLYVCEHEHMWQHALCLEFNCVYVHMYQHKVMIMLGNCIHVKMHIWAYMRTCSELTFFSILVCEPTLRTWTHVQMHICTNMWHYWNLHACQM